MGKLSTTPDTMVVLVLRENYVISTINAVPQSVAHVAHTLQVWHKAWHILDNQRDLVRNGPETCHMTLKLPWKCQ